MNNLGKILKLLFVFLSIVVFSFVKAASIPVENVFSDITPDYKYYNELQTLYDKWMIFPDSNWKFSPNDFLSRAEFVWVTSEVSCKKCIQPNTDIFFVNKYKFPPFFDVLQKNKYFYCIADAKANNYVAWYDVNYKCNDWTYKSWEKPFCLNNTITREEALAIMLRMWNILTAEQAEQIRQEIRNGKKYPILSKDVKPILDNGNVYSFYPDFKKALEYEIVDIDKNWNQKILKLIEKSWDYLYPNKLVTKEDFLKMAYVALKANNNCINLIDNNLALEIQIFEKFCSEEKLNTCKLSNLIDVENTFDFNAKTKWVCEKWVDPINWYIWRFYHEETWEQIIKKWKFINNFQFLSWGKWTIFLVVTDNCWNIGKVKNTIYIKKENVDVQMWLKIEADPISWYWPLNVNLEGIVKWWEWPYKYYWNFWDGGAWEGEKIRHEFKEPWVYQVKLKVVDANWKEVESMITINVEEEKKPLQMWLKIEADPISWYWPLNVNLEGIVKWWEWPYKYYWNFWDGEVWEGEKIRHEFKEAWVYQVKLKVVDANWKEVESYIDINVVKKEYLDVSIDTNPIIWPWPLEVELKWLVNWSKGPFTYIWYFWDGRNWEGENIKHIFKKQGVYEVILKVIDKDWKTWEATVLIKVTNEVDCNKDSDNDGVNDCIDKCPLVFWNSQNSWCPIFDKYCKADCSCEEWYICWDNNPKTCSSNICKPAWIILSPCLTNIQKDYTGITFGNVVCNTCPCTNNRFLDFVSTLRYCDLVFPAITSPDERKIYSRWELFQIEKK